MRVTLAYPWTDPEGVSYAPDQTVDLPAVDGKRLVRDGKARPAPEQPEVNVDASPDPEGDPS